MKALMDRIFGENRPPVEMIRFESLNEVPPYERLEKKEAEIVKGMRNIWYEYVPSCYDGSREVPLVVQIHGGGQDGLRWASYTVWHEIAERNNMIVIYPNSIKAGRWDCNEEEIKYLYDLISHMCTVYKIDKTRIYMQGMSNGDMMTLAFTMRHPQVLAAAGYTSGPSSEGGIDGDRPVGALPIIQERGELDINYMLSKDVEDVYEKRYHMNDINRELWENVNGTAKVLPSVTIRGKDNFLIWNGTKAPIINWEIKDMGHREPVYAAQIYWDCLYSGCRMVNGEHLFENPVQTLKGDDDLYLIALGSNKAYHKNKIMRISSFDQGIVRMMVPSPERHFAPLKLNEMAQTEAMYAPVEILNSLFGAEVKSDRAGTLVMVTLPDQRIVTLRKDSLLIDIDGKYTAMQKPCILYFGCFYIPVEEFMRMVLKKQVSIAHDVMCISDHYALVGKYTARIICKLIGGVMRPHEQVEWE